MPTKRKVGNLLALAVLGTLVQRPMHPYEMASTLRARGKDDDMPIKWGSLYTVVQNLEKHRFVTAIGSVRQGGRPERTVYQITEAGRAELKDWVRDLVARPEHEPTKFKAALSVLGALTPDEAIELLRQRVDQLEQRIARHRATLAADLAQIPRLFLVEEEYDLAMRQAQLDWVTALLDELGSGSFPDLAGWREFHREGTVPPGFAELSERGQEKDQN
ncbi:MAG: PadR family transcriptional regulator [Kibdelosporangium sp.]